MRQVKNMTKQELVDEFNRIPCRCTLHRASLRSGGKEVTWWYEYWVRFPTKPHIPQIYEKDKKFRNHTQALRHALEATRWALSCDWKNNSP